MKARTWWHCAQVLPYFMCSENNTEINRVGRKYHSSGGLLTVQRFSWQPAITDDILAAATERGYPITEDLNGDQFTGFTVAQATTRNGARVSSAAAFLRPFRHRRNLQIAGNATATRIIIENQKAVGVQYYQVGTIRVRVSCDRPRIRIFPAREPTPTVVIIIITKGESKSTVAS